MNRQTGFTLIELMVVVVIIAILTAIAVPQYTDYVTRSKIPGAVSGLSDVRVRMEQSFQDRRTYLDSNGANPCVSWPVNSTAPAITAGQILLPQNTDHFTFTCPAATQGGYTARATGVGSMNGFVYEVDQANARSTTVTGVSGWTGNTSCWVTKKGGVC